MNLQNALYLLAIVAIAIAAYFAIEMKFISFDSDNEVKTELMIEDPQVHSQMRNQGQEGMMDKRDDAMEEDPTHEEGDEHSQEEHMEEEMNKDEAREEDATETETDNATSGLDYQDGSYTVNSSYALPNGGSHDMKVTFEVASDTVTAVSVVFDGDTSGGSTPNQSRFLEAMQPLVIGQDIDNIALSRTGGSSLTTGGFNDALELMKNQAQS